MKAIDQFLAPHASALSIRHKRMEIIGANIANAATPNYKARDIDFSKSLEQALAGGNAGGSVVTSTRHLNGTRGASLYGEPLYRVPLQNSIDGNTVELDVERAQFADNAVRMEASLMFLNSQIKSMLSAIQG